MKAVLDLLCLLDRACVAQGWTLWNVHVTRLEEGHVYTVQVVHDTGATSQCLGPIESQYASGETPDSVVRQVIDRVRQGIHDLSEDHPDPPSEQPHEDLE